MMIFKSKELFVEFFVRFSQHKIVESCEESFLLKFASNDVMIFRSIFEAISIL